MQEILKHCNFFLWYGSLKAEYSELLNISDPDLCALIEEYNGHFSYGIVVNAEAVRLTYDKLNALSALIINRPARATEIFNEWSPSLSSNPELNHLHHYWVHKYNRNCAARGPEPTYLFAMLDPVQKTFLSQLLYIKSLAFLQTTGTLVEVECL
jgi:hypothetical protein